MGSSWHAGDIVLFDTSENDAGAGTGEFLRADGTPWEEGDIVYDYGFGPTGFWNYYVISYDIMQI